MKCCCFFWCILTLCVLLYDFMRFYVPCSGKCYDTAAAVVKDELDLIADSLSIQRQISVLFMLEVIFCCRNFDACPESVKVELFKAVILFHNLSTALFCSTF